MTWQRRGFQTEVIFMNQEMQPVRNGQEKTIDQFIKTITLMDTGGPI
jgi:hypothetical protein